MASDLISRKAMLERLEKWNTSDCMDKAFYEFTKSRINEQSTIDAVEVVRCKDCVYGEQDPILDICIKCGLQGVGMLQNSYCSWGEKKWTEEKK